MAVTSEKKRQALNAMGWTIDSEHARSEVWNNSYNEEVYVDVDGDVEFVDFRYYNGKRLAAFLAVINAGEVD